MGHTNQAFGLTSCVEVTNMENWQWFCPTMNKGCIWAPLVCPILSLPHSGIIGLLFPLESHVPLSLSDFSHLHLPRELIKLLAGVRQLYVGPAPFVAHGISSIGRTDPGLV